MCRFYPQRRFEKGMGAQILGGLGIALLRRFWPIGLTWSSNRDQPAAHTLAKQESAGPLFDAASVAVARLEISRGELFQHFDVDCLVEDYLLLMLVRGLELLQARSRGYLDGTVGMLLALPYGLGDSKGAGPHKRRLAHFLRISSPSANFLIDCSGVWCLLRVLSWSSTAISRSGLSLRLYRFLQEPSSRSDKLEKEIQGVGQEIKPKLLHPQEQPTWMYKNGER